jgi:hypothetical protein
VVYINFNKGLSVTVYRMIHLKMVNGYCYINQRECSIYVGALLILYPSVLFFNFKCKLSLA